MREPRGWPGGRCCSSRGGSGAVAAPAESRLSRFVSPCLELGAPNPLGCAAPGHPRALAGGRTGAQAASPWPARRRQGENGALGPSCRETEGPQTWGQEGMSPPPQALLQPLGRVVVRKGPGWESPASLLHPDGSPSARFTSCWGAKCCPWQLFFPPLQTEMKISLHPHASVPQGQPAFARWKFFLRCPQAASPDLKNYEAANTLR